MTDLEVIKIALHETHKQFAGARTYEGDLIATFIERFLENIEYQQLFGDADIKGDREAHNKMEHDT